MKKRGILKLLLLGVLLLILTGCGIDVSTTIELNGDSSGKRVMTLKLDSETMREFKGKPEDITALLKDKVKAPLEYAVTKAEADGFEATITLPFSSVDDYRNKVKELYALGGFDQEPWIVFKEKSDSIFVKTLKYEDDVETKNLLRFLETEAVSRKLITESDAQDLWSYEYATVTLNGKNLLEGGGFPLKYEDSVDLSPYEVLIVTGLRSNGNWDRWFILSFDKVAASGLPKDLDKELFKKARPQAKPPYPDPSNPDGIIYEFALSDKTPDQIMSATGELFGDKLNTFSYEIKANDPMLGKIHRELKETIPNKTFGPSTRIESIYSISRPDASLDDILKTYNAGDDSRRLLHAYGEQLANGYVFSEDEVPSFGAASVELKLDPSRGVTQEKITLSNPLSFSEELCAEALTAVIGNSEAKLESGDDGITITCDPAKAPALNEFLLSLNQQSAPMNSLFSYQAKFSVTVSAIGFRADTINLKLDPPAFSSAVQGEKEKSFNGTSYASLELYYKGPRLVPITIAAVCAILLIALIVFLIVKRPKGPRAPRGWNGPAQGGPGPMQGGPGPMQGWNGPAQEGPDPTQGWNGPAQGGRGNYPPKAPRNPFGPSDGPQSFV